MIPIQGLEPLIFALEGQRFIQLSYKGILIILLLSLYTFYVVLL